MTVPDVLTIGRVSVDPYAGQAVARRTMPPDGTPTSHDIDALLEQQRAGGFVT
jgi:hypothetical protein